MGSELCRGETRESDVEEEIVGDSASIPAAREKALFLKTICALALRDLGSHPLPQEISATSARRILRERAWIWYGIEGESMDLGWY